MRPAFLRALALLAALLFLAGCTGKVSQADRMACLNLTYYYDTGIPECKSQEDCLSKAVKAFDLDFDKFQPLIRQGLTEYVNRLAKAWLHLNTARQKLREINVLCTASENFSGLRQQANDFSNALLLAAGETDALAALAPDLIEAERAYLLSQDVNQLPDTPLFDDFRELSKNANEFRKSDPEKAPDSYAGLQYTAATRFSSLTASQDIQVKELSSLDFVGKYVKSFARFIPVSKEFVPVISDALSSWVERLSSTLSVKDGMALLQQSKPYDFFEAFSAFVGPNASASQAFLALFSSASRHKKALEAEDQRLFDESQAHLQAVDKTLSTLDAGSLAGFDAGVASSLFLAFGSPQALSPESLSLGSPSQSIPAIQAQATLLSKKLVNALAGGKTLGQRTIGLRETTEAAALLLQRTTFFVNDSLAGLSDLCQAKAGLIRQQVKSLQQETKGLPSSAPQEQQLLSTLASFEQAQGTGRKLLKCQALLEAHKAFEQFFQDPAGLPLEQRAQTLDCIAFAEQALDAHANDLKPLFPSFARVKLLFESNAPEEQVNAACQSLRQQIKESLAALPAVHSIEEDRARLEASVSALEGLGLYSPSHASGKLAEYRRALEENKPYFSGDSLDLEKALDRLSALQKNLGQGASDARQEFLRLLARFLADTAAWSEEKPSTYYADQPLESRLVVEFSNPFPEIREPLQVSRPFEAAQKVSSQTLDPAIARVEFKGEALVFHLAYVPANSFSAAFTLSEEPITTETRHSLESVSLDSAEAKTLIHVHAAEPVQNLFVSASLLSAGQPQHLFLHAHGVALPFTLTGNQVEFSLPHAFDGQEIQADYSLPQPLAYSFSLSTQKALDLNTTQLEYTLSLENQLPLEWPARRLLLPLPLQENAIEGLQLFDETGRELQFLGFVGQNIAFTPPKLLPHQPTQLLARLTLKDFKSYWEGVISTLLGRASVLSQSTYAPIREKAGALLPRLQALATGSPLSSLQRFPEIIPLFRELTELEAQEKTYLAAFEAFKAEQSDAQALFAAHENLVPMLAGTPLLAAQQARLGEARQKLLQASQAFDAGQAESALSILREARKLLSPASGKTDSLVTTLRAALSQWFADAKEKFRQAKSLGLESKLVISFNELQSHWEGLEPQLTFAPAASLQQALVAFKQKTTAFSSQAASLFDEEADQERARLAALQQLREAAAEKTRALSAQLASHSPDELAEAGLAALPRRLDSFQETLKKLEPENPPAADEALQATGPLAFLLESKARRSSLEREEKSLQKLGTDLDETLAQISGKAVAQYNSAATLYNDAETNPEVEGLLTRAKQEIRDKSFLASLASTNAATALLSFRKPTTAFTVPLPVYPLMLVVATILFFRLRQQKREKQVPEEKTVERA